MTSNKKKKYGIPNSTKKNTAPPAVKESSYGEELLAWSVIPMQREPRKAKILIASTLGFLGLVYYVSYWDLLWVGIAALLILGSFNSFIFPARYRFTTEGVEHKAGLSRVFKTWSSFARLVKVDDGIMLSHGRSKLRNRLNPGLFIYFGDDNSKEVILIAEKYVGHKEQTNVEG